MFKMEMIEDLGMLYPKPDSKVPRHYGLFKCPNCGKHFKSRLDSSNKVVSCGCLKPSKFHTNGMSRTKIYYIWNSMRQRCSSPKSVVYGYYGGRGIKICSQWETNFMSFYNWVVDSGYSEELTLDRINTDGDYEPSNCRWITLSENCQNTRMKSSNTSGYKGVNKTRHNRWVATITVNKKRIFIGHFKTAKEGGIAFNEAIIKYGTKHTPNIMEYDN